MSSHSEAPGAGTRRALAWDGPTRAFKWTLVALVFLGWATNKYGSAHVEWHVWNGCAVLILVVFRLLWGFFGGSTARFSHFLRWPGAVLRYFAGLARGEKRFYLGHNPAGAYMIVALLAVVAAQALTGLYSADQDRLIVSGPLARTVSDAAVDFAALWHHRIFDLLLVLVLLHVGANLAYTLLKGDNLIAAMITGRKPARAYADEPRAEPGSWRAALLCLAAATVLVLGGIFALGGRF